MTFSATAADISRFPQPLIRLKPCLRNQGVQGGKRSKKMTYAATTVLAASKPRVTQVKAIITCPV
ncbi:hypothetical protein ACFWY5_12975 [Nonomuraea sp. NPDC059007]|uniref:hypothetical protein n=1 Tax=Nonomuraea sp. NPDC059007 TaxID=3346692 RepID=UPI0036A4968F